MVDSKNQVAQSSKMELDKHSRLLYWIEVCDDSVRVEFSDQHARNCVFSAAAVKRESFESHSCVQHAIDIQDPQTLCHVRVHTAWPCTSDIEERIRSHEEETPGFSLVKCSSTLFAAVSANSKAPKSPDAVLDHLREALRIVSSTNFAKETSALQSCAQGRIPPILYDILHAAFILKRGCMSISDDSTSFCRKVTETCLIALRILHTCTPIFAPDIREEALRLANANTSHVPSILQLADALHHVEDHPGAMHAAWCALLVSDREYVEKKARSILEKSSREIGVVSFVDSERSGHRVKGIELSWTELSEDQRRRHDYIFAQLQRSSNLNREQAGEQTRGPRFPSTWDVSEVCLKSEFFRLQIDPGPWKFSWVVPGRLIVIDHARGEPTDRFVSCKQLKGFQIVQIYDGLLSECSHEAKHRESVESVERRADRGQRSPTVAQIDEFLRLAETRPVAVLTSFPHERNAMCFLAAFLVRFGLPRGSTLSGLSDKNVLEQSSPSPSAHSTSRGAPRVLQRDKHQECRPFSVEIAVEVLRKLLGLEDPVPESVTASLRRYNVGLGRRTGTQVRGDPTRLEVCRTGGEEGPLRIPSIVKFPRTRHLVNLGAASQDDMVATRCEAAMGPALNILEGRKTDPRYNVFIEEKVDGANIGFSVCPETKRIRVQNRSHYVDASSHAQFRRLPAYVRNYEEDLRRILCDAEPDQLASGSILFGEWMYAKHSIHYTRLPSNFMAFDLFCPRRGFLPRNEFRARVGSTRISTVAAMNLDASESLATFVNFAPSNYYDGPIEGIYVRVERDGQEIERAKVVRSDFIAGNEHWTKQMLQRNIVLNQTELY